MQVETLLDYGLHRESPQYALSRFALIPTHTLTPSNVRQVITLRAISIIFVVFRDDCNLHMPLPFSLVTGQQRLLTIKSLGINETSDHKVCRCCC